MKHPPPKNAAGKAGTEPRDGATPETTTQRASGKGAFPQIRTHELRGPGPIQLERVLHRIRQSGQAGITAEHLALSLHIRSSSATARIRELVQMRLVRDSGIRISASSGRMATLWMATSKSGGAR